jgi:hypothetical protein
MWTLLAGITITLSVSTFIFSLLISIAPEIDGDGRIAWD